MRMLKEISDNNSKISDLCEENERLYSLFEFNDSEENILKIISYDSQLFLITYKQKIDYKGVVVEFEYNGYVLKKKQRFSKKSFIMMRCNPHYDKDFNYMKNIFIDDFICESAYRDRGYGTLLMNELIQYAKKLKVQYISGELSFVDIGKNDEDDSCKEKRERLYHFYPKFGFIIEEYERSNGTIGKTIKLNLNE